MDGALPYRIGEWTIDPKRCVAHRQDETVRLEPKATELLSHLTSRSGEVVSRAELLEAVWPGVVVGDEVITNAIAKLRRALGDDPRSPTLIETIPKRGYRVVAIVSSTLPPSTRPGLSRRWWLTALLAVLGVAGVALLSRIPSTSPPGAASTEWQPSFPFPDRPSITVLPFANLSDDDAQAYFVDGLTEDLITDLSRISGLFVIARNSSFTYKDRPIDVQKIGRELGVRFIIEGSVRKVGENLRINVKLIDTATAEHLWAERYDGSVGDVFIFQDKIATKIVDVLSVKLTGIEKDYASFQETHKAEAYEDFLKGWAAYRRGTPEDFEKAIVHLESALAHDPAYGRALAALAAIYWETYQRRWYRRLDLSPLSLVWQRAKEYLERSMVAPTPLAHKVASAMLVTNRRYEEAIIEAERAIAIDSNDPLGYVALAEVLIFTGEPEKALEFIGKAMRLDPQDSKPYLFALGKAQFAKGAVAEAAQTLEKTTQQTPEDRLAWMALISAYGMLDQTEKAKAALLTLSRLQHSDKLVSFTVANAREHWPFERARDREAFLNGLRMAGVPEY